MYKLIVLLKTHIHLNVFSKTLGADAFEMKHMYFLVVADGPLPFLYLYNVMSITKTLFSVWYA